MKNEVKNGQHNVHQHSIQNHLILINIIMRDNLRGKITYPCK
ncbi:hypothetical protein OAN96_01300 [Candidatus Gracilibacteria bacterium]|nr:hypothetical protein [Candidatus Gracilibacteria bacterium]